MILCPRPGEPFYGQDAQYGINTQSYTKLDVEGNELSDDAPCPWAMVRDNVSGLVWEMKTNDSSMHNLELMYHWSYRFTFMDRLNGSRFGGLTNRRVPTAKELAFIINFQRIDPTIDTAYFPYTLYNYWSSWADNPDYAWGVCYCNGRIGTYNIHLGVRQNYRELISIKGLRAFHASSTGKTAKPIRTQSLLPGGQYPFP